MMIVSCKWREETSRELRTLLKDILIPGIQTKRMRFIIAALPFKEESRFISFKLNGADGEQEYIICKDENFNEDITEIYFYEKEMSFKNAGKSVTIIEKTPINTLPYNCANMYVRIMVDFLMQNVV